MNKIEFKDLPDTSTPYNAETFNLLQDNVEDAIDEVKINDTGWIQLTLINGWGSHGTQWQQPSYRKVNNEVFVRGLISGGIANSVCANLPSGYRPRKTTYFIAASGSGNLAGGTIAASGNLTDRKSVV